MVAFAWSAWSRDSFFFFLLRCSCASSDPASFSTENAVKSLDSSIVQTIFSKLLVNDLKIFSTTRQADNVYPFLPSGFATISTRETYSATPSSSFILILSSSPLGVWSRTCFTWLSPLYAFSRISHASFEDIAFAIFSKLDSSTTRYSTYSLFWSSGPPKTSVSSGLSSLYRLSSKARPSLNLA